MLEIDEQPVEAGGLHRLGDVDRARLPQADAERQLAACQSLTRHVDRSRHSIPPRCKVDPLYRDYPYVMLVSSIQKKHLEDMP